MYAGRIRVVLFNTPDSEERSKLPELDDIMKFFRVNFVAALLQDLFGSYFWQSLVFIHNASAQLDSDAQFGRVFFRINCRT